LGVWQYTVAVQLNIAARIPQSHRTLALRPGNQHYRVELLHQKNRALEEGVARTETFIREDLGDARTFSLNSRSRASPPSPHFAKRQ
jgi:hypothetical protein